MLDVVAAIGRVQILSNVMDTCSLTDLDICRILLMLMQKNIVIATPESVVSTAQMEAAIKPE